MQMSANPISNEAAFADAARQHWRRLGEELQADVAEFNRGGGSASFSAPRSGEYRVTNPVAGLEMRVEADPDAHIARYDFLRTNNHSAGAPEGGILSMRIGANGVEFYSADIPLTASEARKLLLDPVLTPPAS